MDIASLRKSWTNLYDDDDDQALKWLLMWEAPMELKIRFPYFFTGHDRDGAPVWVVQFGIWDIRSLFEESTELQKQFAEYIEQFIAIVTQSPKTHQISGKPSANRWVMLVDMEGYSNKQLVHYRTLQTVLNLVKRTKVVLQKEDNLKRVIVLNSNGIFLTLWKLATPILGDLVNFFELYGTKSRRWKPVLLNYIAMDQLPTFLAVPKDSQSDRRRHSSEC